MAREKGELAVMSKLTCNERGWFGMLHNERETFSVSMSDAVFQKHFNAYLQHMGIPTLSYLELKEYVNQVMEQRFQAGKVLEDLEYWRDCDDPEVHIVRWPAPDKPMVEPAPVSE